MSINYLLVWVVLVNSFNLKIFFGRGKEESCIVL